MRAYRWQKAKILPYKHTIAAYGAVMPDCPSQIAYGSCQKIRHAIEAPYLPFSNNDAYIEPFNIQYCPQHIIS